MPDASNTAILILTCNDFEALEITLNQVLKTTPRNVRIYLLSNCHGLVGADVCEQMCSIASRVDVGRIAWINTGTRQTAYEGIRYAIDKHISEEFIIKIDDDVFPVENGWFENLTASFSANDEPKLAYVSGLVNNNPFGFSQLVQLSALAPAYERAMVSPHIAGEFVPGYQDFRVIAAGEVDPGAWGTVWQFPQLARWIHKETTLQPSRYLELVKDLADVEFDVSIRYSIHVMLFRRDLWGAIADGGTDDEEMLHKHCKRNGLKIVINRRTPFVHLYFGPQKAFLSDLLKSVRSAYQPLDQVGGTELVDDWDEFKRNYMFSYLEKKKA